MPWGWVNRRANSIRELRDVNEFTEWMGKKGDGLLYVYWKDCPYCIEFTPQFEAIAKIVQGHKRPKAPKVRFAKFEGKQNGDKLVSVFPQFEPLVSIFPTLAYINAKTKKISLYPRNHERSPYKILTLMAEEFDMPDLLPLPLNKVLEAYKGNSGAQTLTIQFDPQRDIPPLPRCVGFKETAVRSEQKCRLRSNAVALLWAFAPFLSSQLNVRVVDKLDGTQSNNLENTIHSTESVATVLQLGSLSNQSALQRLVDMLNVN